MVFLAEIQFYFLLGHKNSVRTLSLSPEGDRFASCSDDGAVKIWDLGSFQVDEMSVPEKQRAILSEFFMITFRIDVNVTFFEKIGKGSVKGRSHYMKPYTRQSVNSLLTYDHDIRDLSNQSFVFNELNHEIVLCVAFDPDGEEIVAGGQTGTVKVFNLKARNERLCLSGHKDAVNTVSFSPKGNFKIKLKMSLF